MQATTKVYIYPRKGDLMQTAISLTMAHVRLHGCSQMDSRALNNEAAHLCIDGYGAVTRLRGQRLPPHTNADRKKATVEAEKAGSNASN